MIFAGRDWWIRLGWQWCLGACLACAILFVSGCAKMTVPNVEGLTGRCDHSHHRGETHGGDRRPADQ